MDGPIVRYGGLARRPPASRGGGLLNYCTEGQMNVFEYPRELNCDDIGMLRG